MRVYEQDALARFSRPGPFFVVRSACEDDPGDRPFFIVCRLPSDVLFPFGKEPRRWYNQYDVDQAVDFCNRYVKQIAIRCQRQKGVARKGRWYSLNNQIKGMLEAIESFCFYTEEEMARAPSVPPQTT